MKAAYRGILPRLRAPAGARARRARAGVRVHRLGVADAAQARSSCPTSRNVTSSCTGWKSRTRQRRSQHPHHDRGQPRICAPSPRRAQSGRAHRAGRGRGRSRRTRLHRVVDQPRSRGGPYDATIAQGAGGRRQLPRARARPAHVPARADQGGADRGECEHRRAHLRPRPRDVAPARRRGRCCAQGCCRRQRPQG
jgi:hypothetical protein